MKPWTTNIASEQEFDAYMEASQVVIRLKAGDTLTQDQVDAIRFASEFERREEERAIDAFHKGYEEGLRAGGGDALVNAVKARDNAKTQAATERAMTMFRHQRAFADGAQACRRMMADFVEQGGDAVTANSIRHNWNPEWGPAPPAPSPASVSPSDTGSGDEQRSEPNLGGKG